MRTIRDMIMDIVGEAITSVGLEPVENSNGNHTIIYGFRKGYHAQAQFEINFRGTDFVITYDDPAQSGREISLSANYVSGPEIQKVMAEVQRICNTTPGYDKTPV